MLFAEVSETKFVKLSMFVKLGFTSTIVNSPVVKSRLPITSEPPTSATTASRFPTLVATGVSAICVRATTRCEDDEETKQE